MYSSTLYFHMWPIRKSSILDIILFVWDPSIWPLYACLKWYRLWVCRDGTLIDEMPWFWSAWGAISVWLRNHLFLIMNMVHYAWDQLPHSYYVNYIMSGVNIAIQSLFNTGRSIFGDPRNIEQMPLQLLSWFFLPIMWGITSKGERVAFIVFCCGNAFLVSQLS